jgi:hypothetical protein
MRRHSVRRRPTAAAPSGAGSKSAPRPGADWPPPHRRRVDPARSEDVTIRATHPPTLFAERRGGTGRRPETNMPVSSAAAGWPRTARRACPTSDLPIPGQNEFRARRGEMPEVTIRKAPAALRACAAVGFRTYARTARNRSKSRSPSAQAGQASIDGAPYQAPRRARPPTAAAATRSERSNRAAEVSFRIAKLGGPRLDPHGRGGAGSTIRAMTTSRYPGLPRRQAT